MAKLIILAVLGLVATISASALEKSQLVSEVTDEQLQEYKKDLENDFGNVTCETYKAVCEESGNVDPNSVCQIVLQSYLCEKLQDLDGIREIIARVEKLHPTTINTKAGHEFDGQAQTEDEYYDDDDYEDSSEPSTEPSTEPPKA